MTYLTNIPESAKDFGINKLLITRSLTLDFKHRGTQMFIREKSIIPSEIQHVPVTNPNATPLQMSLEELLAHVDTESMNPGTVSEGRVYKSNSYPTMSFKVINNKYLLKHEK